MPVHESSHAEGRKSENGCGGSDLQAQYKVNLTLVLNDPAVLWSAAATKGIKVMGMAINDVLDIIGPREKPALAQCISILIRPDSIPGCSVDDFWIDFIPDLPTRADLGAPR